MQNLISVHPLSSDPTAAWKAICPSQTIIPVTLKDPKSPLLKDHVRFVCMADTHALTAYLPFSVPDGDVFLHAGDFTRLGLLKEVKMFNNFLGTLPHKFKIIIAGNHELTFDTKERNDMSPPNIHFRNHETNQPVQSANGNNGDQMKKSITNAHYLEDSAITVYGLKIYGTPWQPEFCNWAFNLPRGQPCLDKWNLIPDDTDILLTHSPPVGYGDLCATGIRAGCVELLTTVQQRVKPKFHVFGHIHEGYGAVSDGSTVFINASTCNVNYKPSNLPIIFDVPLPEGFTKQ